MTSARHDNSKVRKQGMKAKSKNKQNNIATRKKNHNKGSQETTPFYANFQGLQE